MYLILTLYDRTKSQLPHEIATGRNTKKGIIFAHKEKQMWVNCDLEPTCKKPYTMNRIWILIINLMYNLHVSTNNTRMANGRI